MSSCRSLIRGSAWTRIRSRTHSSHSSPPRRQAAARGWACPWCRVLRHSPAERFILKAKSRKVRRSRYGCLVRMAHQASEVCRSRQKSGGNARLPESWSVMMIEGLLALVCAVLRDIGYTVWEADDPATALHILEERAPIDLLLTDYAMPNMNGEALIERASNYQPGIRVDWSCRRFAEGRDRWRSIIREAVQNREADRARFPCAIFSC
jgi:CheY-like chemotaxis protein